MIEGVSEEMLRRYVAMRHKLDGETKLIQSMAGLLSLLQLSNDDKMDVDPTALGSVQSLIEHSIVNIRAMLDDFIPLAEAKRKVSQE